MGKTKDKWIPKLLFTDQNCRLDGKESPGIGLLLNDKLEPIIPVADYQIYLSTVSVSALATQKEIARELRMFWEYLSRKSIDWQNVSDRLLSHWRDDMNVGIRISAKQKTSKGGNKNSVDPIGSGAINRRLSFVFNFYIWAKNNGYVNDYVIGIPEIGGYRYQITAKVDTDSNEFFWPHLLPSSKSGRINIPTPDDIDKLHDEIDEIFGPVVARRNRLAVEFMNQTGLRGMEVASVKVSMIPDENAIHALIDRNERYEMPFSPKKQGVKTKGGKDRPIGISVDPILLLDVSRYIEFERKDLVDKWKKNHNRSSKEPEQIFLTVAGEPINKKTFQNELGSAFKSAGIKSSPHGLRKAYAMRTVLEIYTALLNKHNGDIRKVDDATVITRVQLLLGHSHPKTTIERYLDLVKLKIFGLNDVARQAFLSEKKESSLRELQRAEEKLKLVERKLKDLTGDIADGLSESISEGLLAALDSEDPAKVFEILKRNLKKGS